MTDQIKIVCENCICWENQHCENFSSKWFGMITSKSQNCGQFKAKKIEKKGGESSIDKKIEETKESDKER